jgi:hypothetical protein
MDRIYLTEYTVTRFGKEFVYAGPRIEANSFDEAQKKAKELVNYTYDGKLKVIGQLCFEIHDYDLN